MLISVQNCKNLTEFFYFVHSVNIHFVNIFLRLFFSFCNQFDIECFNTKKLDSKHCSITLDKHNVQLVKKKEKETPVFIATEIYCTEMKLVPIIMDYCLHQFYALNFFLGFRLLGWSLLNFNFFSVYPKIFQRNRKIHLSNRLKTHFHNISNISLRFIRRRNYS